jgi:DNA-binding NarL/FixJ family response regulator
VQNAVQTKTLPLGRVAFPSNGTAKSAAVVKRITVVLADDDKFMRKGLRALLEAESDMEVVGEANNGRQAVKLAVALNPDVVVMDITMLLLSRRETTRHILQAHPSSKLIVLSTYNDDAYAEHAMVSGVAGYLLITTSSCDLAAAIRAVKNGRTYFCSSIAKRFRNVRAGAIGPRL